ncbi:MAG TPA: DUF11 domain-containing protein, partial [Chloroflexi bacterium]|nr:DUF11 domain-containing protein [Chloroflexota bacterium]
ALVMTGLGPPVSPVHAQTDFDCNTVTDGMPVAQCEALVALYNATDGENWTDNDGWLETTTPCSWYGVTCDGGGNVTQLRLHSNRLSGVVPDEIVNLTALTSLGVEHNQLTGLPSQMGGLVALEYLYLANNQLTSLPADIGDLGELWYLGLTNNLLTALPDTIGALGNLRWLDLSRNMLTSLPAGIGDLVALKYLYLDGNQLPELPDTFGGLTALSELYLHDNPLSGPMPDFLVGLTALGQDDWYFGSPFMFYNTDWCVPATGPVPDWLAGLEYEGTGLICGQPPGGISGSVTLTDTTPIASIQVTLYRALGGDEFHGEFGQECPVVSRTLTIADGSYQFGGLGQDIDYRVHFVDSAGQYTSQYYDRVFLKDYSAPVTVTLGAVRTGIDAILSAPLPPASEVDPGSGTVTYNPDGTANIQQFRGDVSPITVTLPITCPAGATPTDVQLSLMVWGWPSAVYTMTAIGPDLYQATIPADDVETSTLEVSYTCDGTVNEETIGYITLYDPSGFITDAESGEPVVGAKVTLYYVPGWKPRTGPTDTRPNTCESNDSKEAGEPWSQPAPVDEGMIANPENPPIAPAISYQYTNDDGYYGWDVSEGCWYVQVEAEGYSSLVSPVVGVPPEVTDLDLALEMAAPEVMISKSVEGTGGGVGGTANLPLRGVVTYTIALNNTGSSPATGVLMTDTVPAAVDFGGWIERNGAQPLTPTTVITWSGDIAAETEETIRFTATITTALDLAGKTITNTAEFSSANAGSGSDDAIFTIAPVHNIYLPLVLRQ